MPWGPILVCITCLLCVGLIAGYVRTVRTMRDIRHKNELIKLSRWQPFTWIINGTAVIGVMQYYGRSTECDTEYFNSSFRRYMSPDGYDDLIVFGWRAVGRTTFSAVNEPDLWMRQIETLEVEADSVARYYQETYAGEISPYAPL